MMLYCFVQNYHWGKKGKNSEVANLAVGNRTDFKIEDGTPYAELWMGAHPSGPSIIMESGLVLNDWINKNLHVLGSDVRGKFGQLPFLFKVLSVNTALSIQAHPSKNHAELLHKEKPDIYKDPNHKPEMAIALTPFEALCGFRPLNEIKKFLQAIPELRSLIGESLVADFLSCDEFTYLQPLRACFHALMSARDEAVATALKTLITSATKADRVLRKSMKADLVERLYAQYPDDVGVLCIYFFNHVVLKPGEVIYLPANEPHAYISGDCVECMACSDNVVRAGLTPKMKDIETLCEMLSYRCEPPSSKLFQGLSEDEFTVIYKPPVPDFAVAKIYIPRETTYYFIPRISASICIVISGKARLDGSEIGRGSVFFLVAAQAPFLEVTEKNFLLFQAMANF